MPWKKISILLLVIAAIHLIVIAAIVGGSSSSSDAVEEEGETAASGDMEKWHQHMAEYGEKLKEKKRRTARLEPWDYSRKLSLPEKLSGQAQKASGVIIVDLADRRVLWEKNARENVPVASLTKLMTALLLAEEIEKNGKLKLTSVVEMSPAAVAVEGRRYNAGDKLTVKDLLFAMMISSVNDAATQAAISVSGDVESFVRKMNDRAAELGLSGVKFNSPSGLPQGKEKINSMASCDTISRLCEEIMRHKIIMEPAGESYAKLSNGRELFTTNGLLKYPTKAHPYWRKVPGLFGFKTGYTRAAGCCLAFGVTRKGRTVLGCVTGFPSGADRERFCSDLIEWAYKTEQGKN